MDDNKNWKSEITQLLTSFKINSLESVYLIGKVNTLFEIYDIVRFCLNLENSHMIRFIFLDDKSPSFSLDNSIYEKQLLMDLVMNIYTNRTWGCLRLLSVTDKSLLPSVKVVADDTVYPLSSVRGENITLKRLAVNLQDISEHSKGKKLGLFDYCGNDKYGNVICGIGSLSSDKKLVEDQILRWQIPKTWSYEDAVSVPLCYTIAHRMFIENFCLEFMVKDLSIYVQRGGLLVSQAIIYTALSKGYRVFTSYSTLEEKRLIHQLFPEIDEGDVFNSENKTLRELLMIKTNNEGVNIAVISGDISENATNFRYLKTYGQIYLMNTHLLVNRNKTIGMFGFFNALVFHGIPTDTMLDMSDHIKINIQKKIENGIRNGTVKPLRTIILPSNSLNIDALEILNANNGYSNKLVYRMGENIRNENIEKEIFLCSNKSSQIIISNEYSFWLDLVGWLISRGATSIYLFTQQNLLRSTSQRLSTIKNNNPIVNISWHQKKIINYSHLAGDFSKINYQNKISDVFCLGKMKENEVNNVDTVLKSIDSNSKLICIGQGGETTCELRNKTNHWALAISCESQFIKNHIILPELDHLINNYRETKLILLQKVWNTREKEYAASIKRVPNDLPELLELKKKSVQKACFVEVMNKCPPYRCNKDVSPVFVIPSLRPNEMNKLTYSLNYPTFEARLPHDVIDIDCIAKDLFEDMKRFEFNVFTLIINDWGCPIGLNLARYLENNGKLVLLIMLNSSPKSVQNWVSSVLKLGDENLISKYMNLPHKVTDKSYKLSNWDEKLSTALQSSPSYDYVDKDEIREAIDYLRKLLHATLNYKVTDKLFQGKWIGYTTNDSKQDDSIEQYCKNTPVMIVYDSSNHEEMLADPNFAKKINGHMPYEVKTAAHDLNCDRIGVYVNRSFRR